MAADASRGTIFCGPKTRSKSIPHQRETNRRTRRSSRQETFAEKLRNNSGATPPSAVRIAISRCRAAARASKRLATLAQAINKTKTTAAKIVMRAGRTSPIKSLWNEKTRSERPVFDFEYCCSSRAAMVFISASHCWIVTPAFDSTHNANEMIVTIIHVFRHERMQRDQIILARSPSTGNRKPGGMTPSTV